jgi:ribosome-binding factor A
MSSHRIERVSELVKQQVSQIIADLTLTGCGFITVTSAHVSPDLHDGRVYISVIGSQEQKQCALRTLEAAHGRIQQELGQRVILKYTPRLKFFLDETESHAQRIESLLNELDQNSPHE